MPEAEVGAPGSRVGAIGGGQRDEHRVKTVKLVRASAGGCGPGRRLEDQVANRFLSLFLDMESAGADGSRYHVETLSDQALWDAAPIVPKTPPNPLKNDKEFLPHFPYLAEPW